MNISYKIGKHIYTDIIFVIFNNSILYFQQILATLQQALGGNVEFLSVVDALAEVNKTAQNNVLINYISFKLG